MTNHGSDAAGAADRKAAARQLDLGMLRAAMKHLDGATLKDGTWFKKLIADHVKKHQAAVQASTWDAAYPGLSAEARAERHINQVALKASAAGALASMGAATGELLSLVTEGLGAPVGVPAAMLSMGLEATYTALLQIDLACDLASMHGVPFDPDDAGEIATLFAVALEIELKAKAKETGPEKTEAEGLTARLMDLEEGEVATRIGRKLLEESVMKNIVPFVGVAISARWNYVGTRLLGSKANRYLRYRGALRRAFARVECGPAVDPMLLIEGAWLISTSDGEPTHEEVMAVALLAEALGRGAKLDTSAARIDDEDEWLDRLAKTPPESHGSLLETLYLVAATDRELQNAERRILRRVGKALGREIDFPRIEQICRHFADGDDLPARALSGADPRALPAFIVALHGAPGAGKASLRRALLDVPAVVEADLARIDIVAADDEDAPESPGVSVLVARGAPGDGGRAAVAALGSGTILVAAHARDLDPGGDDAVREAWAALVGPDRVHLTATPEDGAPRGVDGLRAALFALALQGVDVTVTEARRAKRPYAAGIIAGAALATAAEALLPGAAALVLTSQVGAIGSLSYLYTGRFIGRGQALAMVPMFAGEAAGGSLFLLAKSFFPPTGIADAAAAAVAASLTVTMLGAVAWTLERGYSLDQKDKLREAFRRLRARSVADRAELLKGRARWRERSFWADLVQRWIFEG